VSCCELAIQILGEQSSLYGDRPKLQVPQVVLDNNHEPSASTFINYNVTCITVTRR